jgi:hypothetical protein
MLGESGYLIALELAERKLAEGLFSASAWHLKRCRQDLSDLRLE